MARTGCSSNGNIRIYTLMCAFSFIQFAIIVYVLEHRVMFERNNYSSQLRYIYADSNTNMSELIKQLEIIKIINETLFLQILELAMKKNTNKVISFLSREEEGIKHIPQAHKQEMINIIDERLKRLRMSTFPITPSTKVSLKTETIPWNFGKKKRGHFVKQTKPLPMGPCQIKPSSLYGRQKVSTVIQSMDELNRKFSNTVKGGRWTPKDCERPLRIAIIIPYRDRDGNFRILLNNLIPKLRRQKMDYTFYVAEQAPGTNFNRGLMRNIGFQEARKIDKYDCYIFNDVDTIIENDYNFYTCKHGAAYHLSVLVKAHRYRLLYKELVGGILSFTEELFLKTNGYSNFFFFWGGEDDNMERRIAAVKSQVLRPDPRISHTTTLYHNHDKIIPKSKRYRFLRESNFFWKKDGLNTLEYTLHTVENRSLYTWIYVSVNEDKYKKMFEEYKSELKPKKVILKAKVTKSTTISKTEPTTLSKVEATTTVPKRKKVLNQQHKTEKPKQTFVKKELKSHPTTIIPKSTKSVSNQSLQREYQTNRESKKTKTYNDSTKPAEKVKN